MMKYVLYLVRIRIDYHITKLIIDCGNKLYKKFEKNNI